jgi:hypothetical protein
MSNLRARARRRHAALLARSGGDGDRTRRQASTGSSSATATAPSSRATTRPTTAASASATAAASARSRPDDDRSSSPTRRSSTSRLDYGLPGAKGYEYTRPFDYFNFQATASSANGIENVLTRGLLIGKSYEAGPDYRGVWGIYGSYDYISPQTFRVSTTALSLGSTGHWWMTPDLSLEGTAMAGVGYTAVGTADASCRSTATTTMA